MKNQSFIIGSLDQLDEAAAWLLDLLKGDEHLAFQGEMGAGKTTLIQAICRQLGVKTEVTSPTFALVYEYTGAQETKIYHFDFYRLDDPTEALDFGLEEYLSDGGLCLMEWPEKVADYLPDDLRIIRIEEQPDGSRLLTLV